MSGLAVTQETISSTFPGLDVDAMQEHETPCHNAGVPAPQESACSIPRTTTTLRSQSLLHLACRLHGMRQRTWDNVLSR